MNAQSKITVTFLPDNKSASVKPGVSLLEAVRKAGIVLPTRCGGKAGCMMCKVSVESTEQAALRPPAEAEKRKLGSLLDEGVRLACQAAVWGDVRVRIPEDPLKAAVRRRLEAARRGEAEELW
ncbi:2Fe-2S iron-sulfur cluster binding domain-containing protein [Paenibacillus tritici]|uniref:2Fe-2S iron-sulfur cluster binding domain-containing protein n=1 Tax=Paenibacillus tritici TaxID=1873425 RepID=A0ABX2DL86_9BACL|nr:2Fe-2S iron-sulfur cluster-binding protein [Paenibacillus tritici]NQX44824.1 2Fe-2S iron-sulfur cluster binding domain-containing protein [Paenibacillus tritici]QUL52890.1 2Fe-2S iron-sulfur cluster binding domain-containing protein [Paenibacillus tritici]